MSRKQRVTLTVSFDLPVGAAREDARDYVEDAVITMCSLLKPAGADEEDPEGDPMFELDRNSVKVFLRARRT
jgi:hypothetical protein